MNQLASPEVQQTIIAMESQFTGEAVRANHAFPAAVYGRSEATGSYEGVREDAVSAAGRLASREVTGYAVGFVTLSGPYAEQQLGSVVDTNGNAMNRDSYIKARRQAYMVDQAAAEAARRSFEFWESEFEKDENDA